MLEIKRKAFESAVALASMPLERRNTIPILSTIRCRSNGVLEFQGTDLDITVSASMAPTEGGWEGQFVIPDPVSASKAVKTVGADIVQFTPEQRKLGIVAGALHLSTATPAAEDFPLMRSVDHQAWAATLSPELIAQLARVATTMSREETRYYLNGILLQHVDGWNYRAVATDGHRLSVLDIALPDAEGTLGADVILPRKAVGILLDAAARAKSPLRLAVGAPAPINEPNLQDRRAADGKPTVARFTFDQADGITATISTKLIDGTYPDYRRVIPPVAEKCFGFKVADLRRAVLAISVGSKAIRAVKVTLSTDLKSATLGRYNVDGFSGSIEIPCEHNAPGFEVGFNGQYLLDMAGAAEGEEVLLSTGSAADPVLIRNPADTLWRGVLMPMRV